MSVYIDYTSVLLILFGVFKKIFFTFCEFFTALTFCIKKKGLHIVFILFCNYVVRSSHILLNLKSFKCICEYVGCANQFR